MRKHFLGILFLFFLCIISCTKSGEEHQMDMTLETENASYRKDGRSIYIKADCDWTLALQSAGGGDVPWASLSEMSGSGDKDVVLTYDYNDSEDARSLSVVLTGANGGSVTRGFVQAGISAESAASPSERPGWLELPQETSNLTYYNHSFSYEGERYRNYSFGWDASDRLARWVAYPLCGFYTKNCTGRSNAWSFDPTVPVSQQPNLTFSYRGSYDRGHQIPSADRLVCHQANAQTFYFVNMTPQKDTFNQGIWGIIEGKVRAWSAESDTLYVVTGCLMDGKSGSTTDAAGNVCPLPSAYFKAVLRYSRSSTTGFSGYSGIGICLNHSGLYGETLSKDMVMSLNDLEKRLGYKLFVNLSSVLSPETVAKIKAQDPVTVPFWGIGK